MIVNILIFHKLWNKWAFIEMSEQQLISENLESCMFQLKFEILVAFHEWTNSDCEGEKVFLKPELKGTKSKVLRFRGWMGQNSLTKAFLLKGSLQ